MTNRSLEHHAIAVFSGGLDSILSVKIIQDMGITVHGIHFLMPWELPDDTRHAAHSAAQLAMPIRHVPLDDGYLAMVKDPHYGYGNALNPCLDCHIYMIRKAADYMKEIGADFIITGEVLGQRPMSQTKQCLQNIDKHVDLPGKLLRPLSAQLLEPTTPETEGIVDRKKLLNINGRSRATQVALAQHYGFTDYPQPAGGCLLTEKHFSNRMKDLFIHGYRFPNDIIRLRWGRHFRISDTCKIIIGRDKTENEQLIAHAETGEIIMQLPLNAGPTVMIIAANPTEEDRQIAANMLQAFSRKRNDATADIIYWHHPHTTQTSTMRSYLIPEHQKFRFSL